MPTYDFDCPKCQRIEEIVVPSFSTEVKCSTCGEPMHRLFSPPDPSRQGEMKPVAGPTRSELWEAYKAHKIRFRVDSEGNDITEVQSTGERVRSEKFSRQHLREAYDPPPKRDSNGVPIVRDRTGRRVWPDRPQKFFVSG